MSLKGVWLPIITPFVNDEFDYESYKILVNFLLPASLPNPALPFWLTKT